MALNAGTGALTGSSYGDLSKHDAFTIQKRMLPIAKRLLTFGKFAQKETKPQKEGLEIRHRRYERFPIVDSPIPEGISPNYVNLNHTTIKHVLKQYGSFVNTTDIMLAASTDPVLQIITERQAQQAGETIDFLTYKEFRAGTQVGYAGSGTPTARNAVNYTISNMNAAGGSHATVLLDRAIRVLENNDASKLKSQLDASDQKKHRHGQLDLATQPANASNVCVHTLRRIAHRLGVSVPAWRIENQTKMAA